MLTATFTSSGAAGTIEGTFVVTNTAAVGCSLLGFPRLQLLAADASGIPTTTVPGQTSFSVAAANAPATLQRLAPGASAQFAVQYSQIPVGTQQTCPTSASVDVYPPGSVTSFNVIAQLDPCGAGSINVSPFFAG